MKLGEILREKNLISREELEKALQIQAQTGEKLGKILVEQGMITEEALLDALSEKLGIPRVKIDAYSIDPSVVNVIPLAMARRYRVIPLFKVEDTLTVAMADPLDVFLIDALRYQTGLKIQQVIATEKDIERAINKYYSVKDSIEEVIKDLKGTEEAEEKPQELSSESSEEASVIKLVNLIISQAIKDRASDIHIEPEAKRLRIRYRIDGILHEVFFPPKHLHPMIISRIKIMSDLDVSERRVPQDGRFQLKVENKNVDMRVSILPTIHGEKAVMRVLDKSQLVMGLEELGFDEDVLRQWRGIINKSQGIILITGPTGSGKTTTLYAVLREINTVEKNIVTVENPVEYELPLINQVQVNPAAGLTFASGLRSILRQDPDIIMIGEIRDLETAEIAIRSALTGHLVLSTLHTNDAPGAVTRLIDMGVEPFLVSSSLIGVLAQRLVRKICPHCKEPVSIPPEIWTRMELPGPLSGTTFYKGKGCRECKGTGYKGRTGIYELMVLNEEIQRLIVKRASDDQLQKAAKEAGMVTLREDGFKKAIRGITTLEEVLRVT